MVPSIVICRSCMHSSRPDWVFGEARLISSTSTTLANTGPGWNSKRGRALVEDVGADQVGGQQVGGALHPRVLRLQRAGQGTGERGLADAGGVLDQHVPVGEQGDDQLLTTRSGAFTPSEMFSARRAPISATSVGSSLGAVAIASWYARTQAPGLASAGAARRATFSFSDWAVRSPPVGV